MMTTERLKGHRCVHWSKRFIDLAIECSHALFKDVIDLPVMSMYCLECHLVGRLGDFEFERHFALDNHTLCLHIRDPVELYCWSCGDFQYSHRFDEALQKSRDPSVLAASIDPHVLPSSSTTAATASSAPSSPIPEAKETDKPLPLIPRKKGVRGIVNMGSTCFMNAVLQVLFHIPVMRTSLRQLEASPTWGPFSCTKPKYSTAPTLSNALNSNGSHCSTGSGGRSRSNSATSLDEFRVASDKGGSSLMQPSTLAGTGTGGVVVGGNAAGNNGLRNASSALSALAHGGSDCIACEIIKLSSVAHNGSTISMVPSQMLFSVWNYAEYLAGYEQQDAHEFLVALLDGLDTHLENFHKTTTSEVDPSPTATRRPSLLSAIREINDEKGEEGVVAEDTTSSSYSSSPGTTASNKLSAQLFTGLMRSDVSCMHCGNLSSREEPFLDISLSLDVQPISGAAPATLLSNGDPDRQQLQPPSIAETQQDPSISIIDCLRHFTTVENLTEAVMCGKCQQPRPAQKRLSLVETPPILVMHLKRFDAFRQKKNASKVSFACQGLDLSPFVSNSNNEVENVKRSQFKYNLMGIVSHKGTLHQGHYISFIAKKKSSESGRVSNSNNDSRISSSMSFHTTKESRSSIAGRRSSSRLFHFEGEEEINASGSREGGQDQESCDESSSDSDCDYVDYFRFYNRRKRRRATANNNKNNDNNNNDNCSNDNHINNNIKSNASASDISIISSNGNGNGNGNVSDSNTSDSREQQPVGDPFKKHESDSGYDNSSASDFEWFRCDDENVVNVDESEVQEAEG